MTANLLLSGADQSPSDGAQRRTVSWSLSASHPKVEERGRERERERERESS